MASTKEIITTLRENFRIENDHEEVMAAFDRALANTLLPLVDGNGLDTPKPKRAWSRKAKTPKAPAGSGTGNSDQDEAA